MERWNTTAEQASFARTMETVRAWVRRAQFCGTEESLWIIFETEDRLGELLVHRAEFAPYRYVSFRVLDLRLPEHRGPVFCFYDDESTAHRELLAGLDAGVMEMEKN